MGGRALLVPALALLVACAAPPPEATNEPSSSAAATPAPTTATGGEASPTPLPSGEPAPTATAAASPATPAEHRIGVRTVDGVGELYDRMTGERFVPRGNNLVRLDRYHSTFNPRSYDRADLDRQLARMAALGYNVVRVFLDHRVGGLSEGPGGAGLSGAYLDNVADFIGLARDHGLFVMLTQDWLPDQRYAMAESEQAQDININVLTESGVAANAAYFRDLVAGLIERGAPLEAIWSYQLRNELILLSSRPPFSLSAGTFRAPNGRTYDLADPEQHQALLDDGIVYWIDSVRAAILELDPTALVSVGFFVPNHPTPVRGADDTRLVESRGALTRSSADFVDIHGYPGKDLPLPRHLANFGITEALAKPVVMGEMGGFTDVFATPAQAAPALISWQADSCAYGLDGWLLWTWDTPSDNWAATDADGLLAEALAPASRPDPCSSEGGLPRNVAFGQPVRSSAALADAPAEAAVDGVLDTIWNAGAHPRQWIEVELAEPVTSGTLRLVVSQFPEGVTEHRVLARREPGGELIRLHTFAGSTRDGQQLTLEIILDAPIRVIRIDTRDSPSWVGWREIEVNVVGRAADP